MSASTAFKFGPLFLCGVLCAGGVSSASAQSGGAQGLVNDSFVINLGAFIVSTDTKARLNGQSSSNPDIDFDQTFGKGSDATRIRADALWRITPAHHVRFMYFNNTVKKSRAISENIEWGDYTFQAGANVDSERKFSIYELAYEYAFIHKPTYEVAGTFGVHYMDLSLKLSGNATFTDSNGVVHAATFSTREASVPAPLPVLGIRAGWAVAPDWYVDVQAQYFSLKINNIDGRVTDFRTSGTWMFSRNFGVGLGYNRFVTTVDVEKNDFNGRAQIGYSGLQLFLTGTF
jgi:hypothetical protein